MSLPGAPLAAYLGGVYYFNRLYGLWLSFKSQFFLKYLTQNLYRFNSVDCVVMVAKERY